MTAAKALAGSSIIEADGPEGKLFACVDPSARYSSPQVCRFRFSATLAPFRNVESAVAAIEKAGGEGLKGADR